MRHTTRDIARKLLAGLLLSFFYAYDTKNLHHSLGCLVTHLLCYYPLPIFEVQSWMTILILNPAEHEFMLLDTPQQLKRWGWLKFLNLGQPHWFPFALVTVTHFLLVLQSQIC